MEPNTESIDDLVAEACRAKLSNQQKAFYVSDYELGEFVYLITDDEQKRRLIDSIQFTFEGTSYRLCCGTTSTWHNQREFTREKTVAI